jgi:hypothetical protein
MKALILKYIEYLFIFLAPIAIGFAYFSGYYVIEKNKQACQLSFWD